MSKATPSEIRTAMRALCDASCEHYGSFSYAAGYFESTLAYLIQELPEKRQREVLRDFATTTARFTPVKEAETV